MHSFKARGSTPADKVPNFKCTVFYDYSVNIAQISRVVKWWVIFSCPRNIFENPRGFSRDPRGYLSVEVLWAKSSPNTLLEPEFHRNFIFGNADMDFHDHVTSTWIFVRSTWIFKNIQTASKSTPDGLLESEFHQDFIVGNADVDFHDHVTSTWNFVKFW